MKTIFGLVLRLVLMLAGLVFLASVLAAALVVLAFWLVRALWARLTGQPVSPWTFQVNRQAMMDRFYRGPGSGRAARPDDANVIDAEIVEVVDVKEIKPPER
ncbi:MAG: hypothetical protein WCG50_06240 [Rhodoferax sp.]|uniref:hypothetical protein n=1 Tax=Rhodoferax sp. TaxID=50421 RepID=UPI003017B979